MLETAPSGIREGTSNGSSRFAWASKRIVTVLIAIVAIIVTGVSIALANATSDRKEQLRYAKETVELGNAQFVARRNDFRGSDCVPAKECKKPSPYHKFDWENDGCSLPLLSSWRELFNPACQQHDFGYRNFGKGLVLGRNEDTRRWIDDRFRIEMKAICNYKFSDWLQYANLQACFKEADVMYAGVRLLNDWSDGSTVEPAKQTPPQTTAASNIKPTLSGFQVTVVGPGHVAVSFNVGWQNGRDPVTCHFFIDGGEADTRQCGTSSSRQFTGLSAGDHSFYATVTDKYGVSSDRSPTITKTVPGSNIPPVAAPTTSTYVPPPPPKPTISNFQVVVYENEPGRVGVAYDVGWQSGRDPVTCHFFIDGAEVFTAQCGTHSSKQFYGISAGSHSFYAIVTDRHGVASNPSPTVVKTVPAPAPPPPAKKITLSKGAAASSGYWYSVVLSGFAAGSSVTVSCHDSKDSNFWTQTFTIGSNGQASDSTLCYSGDGPDHWVTGGGVESNHVGW